jgi:transcriptional regulator GlxA family with amidase domain
MQIAIGVYDHLTILDVIGPYQVLAFLPDAEVVFCAERPGRIRDDNGLVHLEVEHSFDDVPRPDILLVGGGFITRTLARPDTAIVQWIRDAHPHTDWTTSVCTGSLLLGAAGALDGKRATTHWRAKELLSGFGATPVDDRVVVDGKVVTGAGVSAGIDMALTLAAQVAGPEVAQAIQLGIEYDPQPPFDAGAPWKAPAEIVDLIAAIYAENDRRVSDPA